MSRCAPKSWLMALFISLSGAISVGSALLLAALTCSLVATLSISDAQAVKLPRSELVINVISVKKTFHRRWNGLKNPEEISKFVASARIQSVVNTEHGLLPGADIEVVYDIVVRYDTVNRARTLPGTNQVKALNPGDTITVNVYADGTRFRYGSPSNDHLLKNYPSVDILMQ